MLVDVSVHFVAHDFEFLLHRVLLACGGALHVGLQVGQSPLGLLLDLVHFAFQLHLPAVGHAELVGKLVLFVYVVLGLALEFFERLRDRAQSVRKLVLFVYVVLDLVLEVEDLLSHFGYLLLPLRHVGIGIRV